MPLKQYERSGKYAILKSDQSFEYMDHEGIIAYFPPGVYCTKFTDRAYFWVDDFVTVGFANTPFFFKQNTDQFQFYEAEFFKLYKLDIGGWDCDTVASVAITMPSGVTDDLVLWARSTIIRDDGRERWMLNADNIGRIHLLTATPTLIYLERVTGGVLDNTNYNDTLVNRGYIFFCVEVT